MMSSTPARRFWVRRRSASRRKDQAFVDGLKLVEAGAVKTIDETYTMTTGKRRACRNHANEQTLVFQNAGGAKVELIVRAYNDGVAFRYRFPEQSGDKYIVTSEATGFRLPQDGKMWVHPYDKPSKYTPAYETYFVNGVAAGTRLAHRVRLGVSRCSSARATAAAGSC